MVAGGAEGSDAFISQSFADTKGQLYIASGWLYGTGRAPSDFGFSVGGEQLNIIPVPDTQGWKQYSLIFTGTGYDTLTISSRNDPSSNLFDDFSVTPKAAGVPEVSANGSLAAIMATLAFAAMLWERRPA